LFGVNDEPVSTLRVKTSGKSWAWTGSGFNTLRLIYIHTMGLHIS
jgi:hypothetical protein